jgi:hypothetical protein
MRTRRRRYYNNEITEDAPAHGKSPSYYSRDTKLLPFLFNEYGNWEFILNIADSLADLLLRVIKKSKVVKFVTITLKYAIPVSVFTSDLFSKLKKYQKIKLGENDVTNEHEDKIRTLLNYKGKEEPLDNTDIYFGVEVNKWMLNRPDTKLFQIRGYYQYEDLQPLHNMVGEDSCIVITVIEFESCKFAWLLRMSMGYDDELYVNESRISFLKSSSSKINNLKLNIYKGFINHLDIKKNILMLDTAGISVEPRQDIPEEIDQYNINHLSSTIRKILNLKKKRGIGFVGVPGTGKSTLIKKLETIITEFPMIYISPDCFYSSNMVKETFNTISYIQPCLAVIEDLDSCDVKDKKAVLGELLDQIDDVDNRLQVVILTTINDTSMVHYSLINRPGRFDEIIMIRPPTTKYEIYSVMFCRYSKNKLIDENIIDNFMSPSEIKEDIYKDIIKNKYTHADICEIIEKALLLDYKITNEILEKSLSYLKASKQAIRECDFGGNNPMSNEEMYEKEDAEDSLPPKCIFTTHR